MSSPGTVTDGPAAPPLSSHAVCDFFRYQYRYPVIVEPQLFGAFQARETRRSPPVDFRPVGVRGVLAATAPEVRVAVFRSEARSPYLTVTRTVWPTLELAGR